MKLEVMETCIEHTSDVLYFVDGSTAENVSDMSRLNIPVQVSLTNAPSDLKTVNSVGKCAFLRRNGVQVSRRATVAQRMRPVMATYNISGTVEDLSGKYLSQQFTFSNLGNGEGKALVLYPSPMGTRFGPSGGIIGQVLFDNGTPAAWARVTLIVATTLGGPFVFRAQANREGDVLIPFTRIPPLPQGVSHYSAELSVLALANAVESDAINISNLQAANVAELGPFEPLPSNLNFSNSIGLNVIPGEIRVIRSAGRDHLAIQAN